MEKNTTTITHNPHNQRQGKLQTKAPAPINTDYKLDGNGFFSTVTAAHLKESKSSPPTLVSNR